MGRKYSNITGPFLRKAGGWESIFSNRHKKLMDRYRRSPFESMVTKLVQISTYGAGVESPTAFECDEANYSVKFCFASNKPTRPFSGGMDGITAARDSVGDYFCVENLDLLRHARNPICLWEHGSKGNCAIPVAMCEGRETGVYSVELIPGEGYTEGWCEAFFYKGNGSLGLDSEKENEHSKFCEQLFSLCTQGFYRSGSLGFAIISGTPLQSVPEKGIPQGTYIEKATLLETSIVSLPCNISTTKALISMPSCCGYPLDNRFVKSLLQTDSPPMSRKGKYSLLEQLQTQAEQIEQIKQEMAELESAGYFAAEDESEPTGW